METSFSNRHRLTKSPEAILQQRRLRNWLIAFLITGLGMLLGYLIATNPVAGFGLFGAIVGLFILIVCFANPEMGLYIIVVYSFFINFFSNLSIYLFDEPVPIGVFFDILVIASIIGLIVKGDGFVKNIQKFTKNLLVSFIFFTLFFSAIQFINPNSPSLSENIQAFRKFVGYVLVMFLAYSVFSSYEKVKNFIRVLFVASIICALYGIKQKWFGFFGYELDVLMRDPKGWGLIFNWGDVRISSTMSDPAAYGIVMAVCAVFFLILATNQKNTLNKIILISGSIILITGMGYSGTRTAYAMMVAAVGFFIMLYFDKKSTRMFALVAIPLLLFILYAPIYGNSTIQRFRTTFNGSQDESYKVRVLARAFIQPYIRTHPIGGGLGTTGFEGAENHPGHYLAMFQTDSGYVKRGAETGWTGLAEICILYFIALLTGIRGFFSVKSDKIKIIYAAVVSGLFAFYIAELAQSAIGQITDVVVYYPFLAIILKLKEFDSETLT
jgi:hypothetical protein